MQAPLAAIHERPAPGLGGTGGCRRSRRDRSARGRPGAGGRAGRGVEPAPEATVEPEAPRPRLSRSPQPPGCSLIGDGLTDRGRPRSSSPRRDEERAVARSLLAPLPHRGRGGRWFWRARSGAPVHGGGIVPMAAEGDGLHSAESQFHAIAQGQMSDALPGLHPEPVAVRGRDLEQDLRAREAPVAISQASGPAGPSGASRTPKCSGRSRASTVPSGRPSPPLVRRGTAPKRVFTTPSRASPCTRLATPTKVATKGVSGAA